MLLYCPSAQNARHNACLAAKPHAGLMCSLGIDLQGLASMLLISTQRTTYMHVLLRNRTQV